MTTVGFLHTADVHVATFTRLLAAADPTAIGRHVVDATLLADARERGVDEELRARVVERLRSLAATVDVIVCTCSTVSGVAEAAEAVGVPVVRIDRPMAREAVRAGRRIAVVAAVESTISPTLQLLGEEAAAAGVASDLVPRPCFDAWSHFEAGDHDAYLDAIARHVDQIAGDADVIVLAQASMAPAAQRCATTRPVLTSPTVAIEAALAQSARGH